MRQDRCLAPITLVFWFAFAIAVGCRPLGERASENAARSPFGPAGAWALLYRDSAVSVALDTTQIESRAPDEYLVRFQTRWVAPHRTQAPSPFNRELIQSLMRCNPTRFRTVGVSVYLDEGPVVARQGGAIAEAEAQPWKTPQASTDVASLGRACDMITARSHSER